MNSVFPEKQRYERDTKVIVLHRPPLFPVDLISLSLFSSAITFSAAFIVILVLCLSTSVALDALVALGVLGEEVVATAVVVAREEPFESPSLIFSAVFCTMDRTLGLLSEIFLEGFDISFLGSQKVYMRTAVALFFTLLYVS